MHLLIIIRSEIGVEVEELQGVEDSAQKYLCIVVGLSAEGGRPVEARYAAGRRQPLLQQVAAQEGQGRIGRVPVGALLYLPGDGVLVLQRWGEVKFGANLLSRFCVLRPGKGVLSYFVTADKKDHKSSKYQIKKRKRTP